MAETEYELVGVEAVQGGPGVGIAPSLSLTDQELLAATRAGQTYEEAEGAKAERLAREHGISPDAVRVAESAGMPPARYARLAKARNILDWRRIEAAADLERRAAEQARLEDAVAAARKS